MNCENLLRAVIAPFILAGAFCAQAESLFLTPVALKARPAFLPAVGVAPIALNDAARADLRPGGTSTFRALSGEDITVRWSHSFDHSSGNVTWIGEAAPYGQLNRVALTFFSGGITGTISAGSRLWDVSTYGSQAWLTDYKVAGIRIAGPGDERVRPADAKAGAKAVVQAKRATAPAAADASAPDASMADFPRAQLVSGNADVPLSIVDMLIMDTTELRALYGGVTQSRAVMDRLIAFANQTYLDSGVTNLRLNLVASGSLPGTDGRTISQILNTYNPARPEYLRGANIAELREQTGADLVAILVPQDSVVNGGLCGEANLPMLQRDLATQAHEMLSVTASGPNVRGSDFSCGTDAIFVHELGHNFGLMHDRTTLVGQGAPLASQNLAGGNVGAFAFGFGYGIAGKFCDIMCYPQTFGLAAFGNITSAGYQTSRPIFSNPTKQLSDSGEATGVPETDPVNSANASLALANAAPKVAAYRARPAAAADKAATARVFPIQSGWWWNPDESGRGFFIEVRNGTVLMSGYIYGSNGKPSWFIATGPVVGNAFTGTMLTFNNGQTLTGAYRLPTQGQSLGSITVTFDEPDYATIDWPGGSVPIVRQNYEDDHDNTSEATAPYEALGDSGWWWNPAESGRGYTLEIQADTIVIACYVYDAAGDPVWLLGSGKLTRFDQFKGKWIQLANGQTVGGAYKLPSVVSLDAGDLAIDFATYTDATLTLPDGRKIPITRQLF